MSVEDELRVLEEQLLQPDFRRDRKAVSGLLANGFREFGSSGRVWSKQQILDKLETEPQFQASLQNFHATELAPGVFLVTYKVIVAHPEAASSSSLRSSIWIKRDNLWQMIFHQGTPTS